MSKKTFVLGIVSLALLGAAGIAVSQVAAPVKKDLYSQVEIFSYALTTIQSDYVLEKTPKELIYGALHGMLASLDAHSQFMDQEEYHELKTETEGKFGGLGVEIAMKDVAIV